VAEADLVALGERGENFDGLGTLPLLLQIAEMVERVDYGGVESVVLLGGRAPEKKGVEIERDVLVEEWNSEVRLRLREQDTVIVSKSRADDRHGNIVGDGPTVKIPPSWARPPTLWSQWIFRWFCEAWVSPSRSRGPTFRKPPFDSAQACSRWGNP
jgi:hypothetical protein